MKSGWQPYLILFTHSIDWLLTNRNSDFQTEWNTRFRTLPLFSKLLPMLDQQNAKYDAQFLLFTSNLLFHFSVSHADLLITKYLLIAHNILSHESCHSIIDDLFKASPRELPYVFRAIGVLLHQNQVNANVVADYCELFL